MEKMMYLLAQYLAAAGISFLEKEQDERQTKLGFSIEKSSMYSRPLSDKGDTLSVNYRKFALEWNSNDSSDTLRLDGTTHAEVLRWIVEMSLKAEINQRYNYSFHYESPYAIKDNFMFKVIIRDYSGIYAPRPVYLHFFHTTGTINKDIFLINTPESDSA